MSCMVCRKFDVMLFNVGSNYGTINHTVGDDFIEIYGDKVRIFLTPESCVCNVCMNILDNVTKLMKYIWSMISTPCDQAQPSRLSKFWKIFASLKLDIEIEDVQDLNNRTPTPKLLDIAHIVPYNENLEVQLAERERLRSLSRSSSYFTRSVSDTSEVHKIFRKRRKRTAGHNWTRRKGSRSRSLTSSGYGRKSLSRLESCSPLSDYSYSSTYPRKYGSRKRSLSFSRKRSPSVSSVKRQKRSSSTWTRSQSRAQEEESRVKHSAFRCSVEECNVECNDIETMNQHNIDEHQMLCLHYCEECREAFTTAEILRLDKKSHNNTCQFCPMCALEHSNSDELQLHMEEHNIYSVMCKYCDKSFLTKQTKESHVELCHKDRHGERRPYRRKLILDRIDKTDHTEEKRKVSSPEFEVRYLHYSDMECEEEDLEVTIPNLLLSHLPVYTNKDGGMVTDDSGGIVASSSSSSCQIEAADT